MPYKDPEAFKESQRRYRQSAKGKATRKAWEAETVERRKAYPSAQYANFSDERRQRNVAASKRWFERNPQYQTKKRLAVQEAEAGRRRPDSCEICGSNQQEIHFDHCHQRGVFRGWICYSCNTVLGHVQDDPDHLRKLIAYLERTKDIVPPQLTLPV